jgi:hypothetical protein
MVGEDALATDPTPKTMTALQSKAHHFENLFISCLLLPKQNRNTLKRENQGKHHGDHQNDHNHGSDGLSCFSVIEINHDNSLST